MAEKVLGADGHWLQTEGSALRKKGAQQSLV